MVGSAYLNDIPIQGGKMEEKGNTDWGVAQEGGETRTSEPTGSPPARG